MIDEIKKVKKEQAETLATLRKENKKSRAEIAAKLNVSTTAIANYELGIRKLNIEQVLVLAKLYGVSAEEIIIAQLNCQSAR